MSISNELLAKYNMVSMEEFIKPFGDNNDSRRMFYQTFLEQTDHISLKIFESFIEDMATASITETIGVIISFFKDVKVIYADVLVARKAAREEINKLHQDD